MTLLMKKRGSLFRDISGTIHSACMLSQLTLYTVLYSLQTRGRREVRNSLSERGRDPHGINNDSVRMWTSGMRKAEQSFLKLNHVSTRKLLCWMATGVTLLHVLFVCFYILDCNLFQWMSSQSEGLKSSEESHVSRWSHYWDLLTQSWL